MLLFFGRVIDPPFFIHRQYMFALAALLTSVFGSFILYFAFPFCRFYQLLLSVFVQNVKWGEMQQFFIEIQCSFVYNVYIMGT